MVHLVHISDASSPSAGSLISFQLIPNHIRGISLHFLTLSYGGGCFLGAFLIQLAYFLSGGKIYTYTNVMMCVLMVTQECHWDKQILFTK